MGRILSHGGQPAGHAGGPGALDSGQAQTPAHFSSLMT